MKVAQIVLIEDNPADVMLIELALKEHGIRFEMRRFAAGCEAVASLCFVEAIDLDSQQPDAILLDLNTPRSDGFAVLGRLRQTPHLADVPIAVITSSTAVRDHHRSKRAGADFYIEKHAQLEAFIAAVGGAVKLMLQA
mgnify:CR=1 FL=1